MTHSVVRRGTCLLMLAVALLTSACATRMAEAVILVTPPGGTCIADPRFVTRPPVAGMDYCFQSTDSTVRKWSGATWVNMVPLSTLSTGAATQLAYFTDATTLTGSSAVTFAGGTLDVAAGGAFSLQALGPLRSYLRTSAGNDGLGYQGFLSHVYAGTAPEMLTTIGNDKVSVGGWSFRGSGSLAPIYGGNFGVRFTVGDGVNTLGANGVEIDVQNHYQDLGATNGAGGRGLWINGGQALPAAPEFNRWAAIHIDTQDSSKWWKGIVLGPGFTAGGASGVTMESEVGGAGLLFDGSSSNGFIVIRPKDNVAGLAMKLTTADFLTINWSLAKNGDMVSTGTALLGGGDLFLGTASTTAGRVLFRNTSNAFQTIVRSGVIVADLTLTLPPNAGTAGWCLTTDGGNPITTAWLGCVPAAYAGQTSITTLGTITTGTWNAGSVTASNLAGADKRFVCVDTNGLLYRSTGAAPGTTCP